MADFLEISDLRRACSMLLDEAERRFGRQVDLADLAVDYYWNVPLAAAFDVAQPPEAVIDCGQVSDDAAEIAHLVHRADGEAPALWHELDHLVGALRLLAFLDLPGGTRLPVDSGEPDDR